MTIHQDSDELLAAIPRVFEGIAVTVLDGAGAPLRSYGAAPSGAASARVDVPEGAVVAAMPAGATAVHGLIQALLDVLKERERLEGDMDSMNDRSMSLLEQVAMYGDTLPKLSGGGDDAEIAAMATEACRRAAGVRHVVYLSCLHGKDLCEVVAHCGEDPARAFEGAAVVETRGFLADVLAADGEPIVRTVGSSGRMGEPGSAESLAERDVIGVPVTYGAGDKRIVLGALVLVDKVGAAPGVGGVAGGEFGTWETEFAMSFAAMLGAVLGARKTAALGKELSMAQTIQRQVLPERAVVVPGFEIASSYEACGAVGGDYFEYARLADGRTLVAVADVSGHNLASGMLMVAARSTLRTLASVHSDAAALFSAMASLLHGDLQRTERFLTAAGVVLSPGSADVDHVSAGHTELMVYRAAGDRVERVPSDGTILGFLPDVRYEARRIALQRGDCLLLYTDGVTEAVDPAGDMFGEDRLAAVFSQLARNRSAQRIVDGIVSELDNYRGGGGTAADDVTAVVVRCLVDGAGEQP
ncbi:MAG: PP2C family protein-serine/threonine phosphatase [Planctomycetota bacterium]